MRTAALAALLAASTAIAGCAATGSAPRTQAATAGGCDLIPKARIAAYYTPAPRSATRASYPPLPDGTIALAHTYRLHAEPARVAPCDRLRLKQEIVLQRSDAPLKLREVREFYAEDGTLVARQSADVTEQLDASGAYQTSVSLPIPQAAPPGMYRIVSKLLLDDGQARPRVLGRTQVSFRIVE